MKDKLKSFEQKSNNRFELADKFIKDSKQAKIIASKENPEGIRDFLKKIGSNFQIQNQNISFSPRGAWQIVANSALSASPAGEATAPQVRKTSENSEIVNWRKGWDLNPRCPYGHSSFRNCRTRPLCDPSIILYITQNKRNRLLTISFLFIPYLLLYLQLFQPLRLVALRLLQFLLVLFLL